MPLSNMGAPLQGHWQELHPSRFRWPSLAVTAVGGPDLALSLPLEWQAEADVVGALSRDHIARVARFARRSAGVTGQGGIATNQIELSPYLQIP